MGSYVSEGVQAIRCELVSSSCWKPVPFLDMRALHNEAVMEIGLSTFDALKTGVGQHLGWNDLM